MKPQPLRILTVAPTPEGKRAPSLIEAAGVAPVEDGHIASRALSRPERDQLQREIFEIEDAMRRQVNAYNAIPKGAQPAVMAERLRAFAARSGPPSMVRAGQLLREHGDAARAVLGQTWRPDWAAPLARIDTLLDAAGVPGPLLGLHNG